MNDGQTRDPLEVTEIASRHGVADPCSEGLFINARDQVVGGSWDCGMEFQHSFLWEKGSIVDLLTLVQAPAGMQLRVPAAINERGEIAIQGILANGDLHAILLIPCDDDHPGVEGCDYSMVEVSAAVPQTGSAPVIRSGSVINEHSRTMRHHGRVFMGRPSR